MLMCMGGCCRPMGDALVEEAPIFAISNYDVTFFCRRHLSEVGDKRIWASPPIAWNEVSIAPSCSLAAFLGCSSRVPRCQEQKCVAPR